MAAGPAQPTGVPAAVLAAYGWQGARAQPLGAGLINDTFAVADADGKPYAVVQRLHSIFEASVNLDLEAVADHLQQKGVITPVLIRTREHEPSMTVDGRVWRAISYERGRTIEAIESPQQAREAAALVGRVHRALDDFDYSYRHVRAGVHDTEAHLSRLRDRVDRRADTQADKIADEILVAAASLPGLSGQPRRHCHGDLKISNILFEEDVWTGRCLVDLDTFGHQPIAFELGDALRSWCNPAGEDRAKPIFDLEIFEAAIAGYAVSSAGLLSRGEIASIVDGTLTIAIELAARFAVDVYDDCYFGWDSRRFDNRREHNLVRARGQLELATSLSLQRRAADELLNAAFGR